MHATAFPVKSDSNPATAELTPLRVFKILLFSTLIWCLVALYIRAGGAAREFFTPTRWGAVSLHVLGHGSAQLGNA